MSQLDPRIEVIRKQYDLRQDDFWKLPQGRDVWLVKHSAIEVIAAKAGITFDMPEIVQANAAEKTAVIIARGFMGDRSEWSFGEATPYNNKNVYTFAMAEKRAKDRVVLKLVGLHGFAYSEDESDEFKEPPTKSSAALKREDAWAEFERDLADVHTLVALESCKAVWRVKVKQDGWTAAWIAAMPDAFAAKEQEIKAALADDTESLIQEQFPGARKVNEHISTIQAG